MAFRFVINVLIVFLVAPITSKKVYYVKQREQEHLFMYFAIAMAT